MSERGLSAAERAVWLMDRAAPLNGVIVARIEGPLDTAGVRAGLARLQRRHPLLRAHVGGDLRAPRFVDPGATAATPVALRVLRRRSDQHWEEVAEEELNLPFDPHGAPLMRAALLEGDGAHDLVLAHHHMISDALSAVSQVRELLECAAGLAPGEEPSFPLRPAMNDLFPAAGRGVGRLGALGSFVWQQAGRTLAARPRRLAVDEQVAPAARKSRVLHHALTEGETASLAARARKESTTVQGALQAALLLAAGDDLQGGADRTAGSTAGEESVHLGCFSGVNLRDQLTPSVGEEVGLYVSQATTFLRVDPQRALWDLAREAKARLDAALARGEPYVTFPLLGLFVPSGSDPLPGLVRRIDQAIPAGLGITNIGRLGLPERYGALSLDRLHFAIGLALVAPLAMAVCTFRGRLSFNVVYVEPLLGRARAVAIAEGVRARLVAAGALE
ncbi:MAG: hypothetical protein EXR72_10940 [Myxococcales bacterium]|nr:hypothetical protein [Myxococcales bacterium]